MASYDGGDISISAPIADSGAGDGSKIMTVSMYAWVTVTAGFTSETCANRVLPITLTPT